MITWTIYDLLFCLYALPGVMLANRRQIEGIREKKISFGKHPDQYLLLFEPEQKKRKNNFIFYLHGGGWWSFSPRKARFAGLSLASEGYITISAGYRLLPDFRYPTQIEDTFNGFNKALSLVDERYGKEKQGVIMGTSAGGHLGGVLFCDRQRQKEYKIDHQRIKGFISHCGGINLKGCQKFLGKKLIDSFMGGSEDLQKADPFLIMKNSKTIPDKPVLCIHGTKDPFWNYEMAQSFVDYINEKANKNLAELYTAEGKHHNDLTMELFLKDREAQKKLNDWLERLE